MTSPMVCQKCKIYLCLTEDHNCFYDFHNKWTKIISRCSFLHEKKLQFLLVFFYFKNYVILFLVELFSRNRFWPWNSDTEWDCATRLLRMEWLETLGCFNPLSTNPTKRSNTLKQFIGNLPMNCLSLFGHFVGLVLKGLR